MFIQFFYTESIAHLSYMLIANDQAIVIDPKRDIQDYLDEAITRNIEIKGIFLTHPHADFVAGHIELSQVTGAPIYAHKDSPFEFNFVPVSDDFEMHINHLKITGLETPGHTPFDVSFVVTDTSRGEKPVSVFTGDTLFVNDAGRPDLFPGLQDELAKKMFHSLQKIKQLPDFTEVYPAHAAGTLCGKKLVEKRSTTIGYEKLYNDLMQIDKPKEFANYLLSDLPTVPRHFRRCAGINIKKIAPLKNATPIQEIDFKTFNKLKNQAYLIDLRPYDSWAQQHLPGSYSFDFKYIPLSQYAGWLLEPEKEIVLLTDKKPDLEKVAIQFRRVGLDQKLYLLNHFSQIIKEQNIQTEHTPLVDKNELDDLLKNKSVYILDIRQNGKNDFDYEFYQNIPLMSLENRIDDLKNDKDYVIVCDFGISSVAAASIISSLGKNNIRILAGGIKSL